MSLKASAFAITYPMPKTQDKFYVHLPGSSKSLLRVSATSLPYSERSEGVIWLLGRPVYMPTGKLVKGEWSCVLEEDASMGSELLLSSLERRINSYRFKADDIIICLCDQMTGLIPQVIVCLKYAWLKSIEPIELDWSKPTERVKYKLTFKYSGIQRIVG